jgi:hypothetical protein
MAQGGCEDWDHDTWGDIASVTMAAVRNLEELRHEQVADATLISHLLEMPEDMRKRFGISNELFSQVSGQWSSRKRVSMGPPSGANHLARLFWEQAQFAGQLCLRIILSRSPLIVNETHPIHSLVVSAFPSWELLPYRVYITGQNFKYGELADAALAAMILGVQIFILNQGVQGLIGFGPDGMPIAGPDLSNLQPNAIVLWCNGDGASAGTHWDVIFAEGTHVNSMWMSREQKQENPRG